MRWRISGPIWLFPLLFKKGSGRPVYLWCGTLFELCGMNLGMPRKSDAGRRKVGA